MTAVTITPLGSYRNERPYPFCPGCGHGPILDALDRALALRGAPADRVVVVSDIGCSGLSDQYFATSAFHGLHGRSITYATGIKLADPTLEVVVIMGDGGTGIGGAHLINAARRNVGITVLVMNNLNFGMTGGQHSTTTPEGAITSTTPGGNLERPLDICGTAAVNGAALAYRCTSFDDDLGERIAEAMAHPGFAVLDVWELCSAYYVRSNRFSRKGMEQTMEELGLRRGYAARRDVREFSAAYREAAAADAAGPVRPGDIPRTHRSGLDGRRTVVLAGAAGGRVLSAARAAARAAIASGLYAAQRDDYPVTVKTGHSVASLVVDPHPIDDVSARPDVVALLAPEGAARAARDAARLGPGGLLVAVPGLDPPPHAGRTVVLDTDAAGMRLAKADLALAATAAIAALESLFPLEALRDAVAGGPKGAERMVEVVGAGEAMAAAAGG
ncbi:MAG: 2-oxoacid:acceptor oxidoreductase family protein [Actinobacteria bacterium]|nr:2-oxoacid:acceptor oxidoreductase family protein [Actinomycetota bacterium]